MVHALCPYPLSCIQHLEYGPAKELVIGYRHDDDHMSCIVMLFFPLYLYLQYKLLNTHKTTKRTYNSSTALFHFIMLNTGM